MNNITNEIIEPQTAGENVTPDPSLGDTDAGASALPLDAQSATAAPPHVSEVHPKAEAESSEQTQRQFNDPANGSTGNSPDQMPNPYDLSTEKQDGQTVLRMHTPQPRVTRLKPKAVMLILLAAAGAVGTALVIGLGGAPSVPQVQRRPSSNSALQSSSEVADNNALVSTLPQTYTWPQADNHAVAPDRGHTATAGNLSRPAVSKSKPISAPDRQQMRELKSLQRQWRQAMNAPVVFAGMVDNAYNTGGTRTPPMANASSFGAGNGLLTSGGVIPPGMPTPDRNSSHGDQGTAIQQEHRAFMKSSAAVQSYLAQPLTPPVSPYEIQAGTVIPGALVTGINSDLPGQIIGTVTQNIFDSVSGKYLLIPQGSRLLGRYSSVVGNGENHVLVAWQRLILPNGDSIVLNAMPGTNQEGQSGLHDRVNYHFAKLAQAAALSTAIAYGGNLAINPNSTSTNQDVVGNTIAQEGSQIGQKIIDRQLNVQPTITIRPGWPFRVLVNEDMILKPYRH
ncbi:MAG: TrbI/VirB10 family protein [Phycisphaerae bacterium]